MLADLNVVELGRTISSAAAGRLLGQLGAKVTRVDIQATPSATSADSESTMRARLLRLLSRDTQIIPCSTLSDQRVEAALDRADIVLTDPSAVLPILRREAYLEFVRTHNRRSWVSISPFGLQNDRTGYAGSEITIGASGGIVHFMRDADGRPMKPAGFTCSIVAGNFAALAGLHGLMLSDDRRAPAHLDLAQQDAVVTSGVFLECAHELFECPGYAGDARHGPPSGLVECADGLMWVQIVEDHQWRRMLGVLGDPAWAKGINTVADRLSQSDLVRREFGRWAKTLPKHACVNQLQQAGVPATVVNTSADLMNPKSPDVHPGFFVPVGDQTPEAIPGVPYTLRPRHGQAVTGGGGADPLTAARPARVLDMTNVLVGPLAASWLGAMRVDVLKIEDPDRLDVYRRRGPFPHGLSDLESSAYFASANYCKRSFALSLGDDAGLGRLQSLVASADLVLSNMSPHRAALLGVTPDAVDGKSDTVIVSAAGFSELSENATFRSYGMGCHASGGMVHLSRDRHGIPHNLGTAWGDPLSSIWIAILSIAQLLQPPSRRSHVNIAMTEVVACVFPEFFSAFSTSGVDVTADGNRLDHAAPNGIYSCTGNDRWLALSVESDADWQRLLATLDFPAELDRPEFATHGQRLTHQDTLDDAIEAVTSGSDRDELFHKLQSQRVACAPVLGAAELVADSHLAQRNLFQMLEHPRWARRVTGLPWRIVDHGSVPITPAPLLGADTDMSAEAEWPTRKGNN